jgi:transposase
MYIQDKLSLILYYFIPNDPLYENQDVTTLQVLWIDASPTLEEYQVLREIHETILLALGDLSLVNRQAVIGFYLQGYNYEELAQLLGVPISTVKGRLFQGRKLLKTLLRPLANALLQPIDMQRKEQKVSAAYGDKKAVLQELPGKFGGVMVAAVHPSGWRLVVIFAEKPARDLKEETRQSIRQTRQEL